MSHPIDIHVGKRLRLRRTVIGLSQEQVGEAVGITFQQVQKNERAVNRIAASRLWQLSQLLKCDIGYFFEDLDSIAHKVTHEEHQLQSRETLEMMRAYYKIPDPKVRKAVLDLIRAMS